MRATIRKQVIIHGQADVRLNLMKARGAAGLTTIYQTAAVKPHDFDTDRPRVSYVKDGVGHEIACDFIAGCDGQHRLSRASVPPTSIRTFQRIYPCALLGRLSEPAPVRQQLCH